MNSPANVSLADLIAALEARARAANNLAELGFSMANDSYNLLAFRQALVFVGDDQDARLLTVSGLAKPTEDSPYLLWLRRSWPWLAQQLTAAPGWLVPPAEGEGSDIPAGVLDGWQEWWPQGVFGLPIQTRSGQPLGCICFLLDQPPNQLQVQALNQLRQTWAYC